MDFIQGRFLLWAFLGFLFLFVLLFTALLLDDRDFRLAFGLPVAHCRFATADPPVDLQLLRLVICLWFSDTRAGGCESSRERSFMVSSYTP